MDVPKFPFIKFSLTSFIRVHLEPEFTVIGSLPPIGPDKTPNPLAKNVSHCLKLL